MSTMPVDVHECAHCGQNHGRLDFTDVDPIDGKMPMDGPDFVLWAVGKCPVTDKPICFGLNLPDPGGPYRFTVCRHCDTGMAIDTSNPNFKALGALCNACDKITGWDEMKWEAIR